MTEQDLKYLKTLFTSFKIKTQKHYSEQIPSKKNTESLLKHLKRIDHIEQQILIQHQFVMNNLAFGEKS